MKRDASGCRVVTDPELEAKGHGESDAEPVRAPAARARRTARALVLGSAAGFAISWLTLSAGLGLATPDAVLLSFLIVGLPGLALAQVPLIDDEPLPRISVYWTSVVSLAVLGLVSGLVGARDGGAEALGLVSVPLFELAAWTAGLVAGGFSVMVLIRWAGSRAGLSDAAFLRRLLPVTRSERASFGVLSVAAGVGEELAYRGYAIPVMAPLIGTSGAVLLTSGVFGVLHGYQGPLGVVRASAIGGIFAIGFVLSGTLWPIILAHTLIDLVSGLAVGERLLVEKRAQ